MQAQLIDLIFRKSLRITSATKGSRGVGAIVNLQSNDGSKIWELIPYLHAMWSAPLQARLLCSRSFTSVSHWPFYLPAHYLLQQLGFVEPAAFAMMMMMTIIIDIIINYL